MRLAWASGLIVAFDAIARDTETFGFRCTRLLRRRSRPDGHAPKVPALIGDIERRSEFVSVRLAWASGLMVVVRKADQFVPCGHILKGVPGR